jgi:hypothetical protein
LAEIKIGEKKVVSFEEKGISLKIALISITAALYVALGFISIPIGFLDIQFRIAEVVVGMCIIFPYEGLIGKIIGVFFVNIFSPLGLIDLLSVIVNIPALYCIILFRSSPKLRYFGAVLYANIISLYVAIIIYITFNAPPVWITFIQVLFSEVILAVSGVAIFSYIKNKYFEKPLPKEVTKITENAN